MYVNFGAIKSALKSEVSISAYGKKQFVGIFYTKKTLKKGPFSTA